MKAEARKNICCRKYSELPFRELMNTVGLTLAQNCVGGTLSSADSGGRFQYRNLFFNGSEKIEEKLFGGKRFDLEGENSMLDTN